MNIKNCRFFNDIKTSVGVGVLGLLVVFMALTVFLISLTVKTFDKSNEFPANVITVSGEGEVIVIPDIATFTYTIRELADTVDEAQLSVTNRNNQILETLKEKSIEEKDLRTISYNIHPRYEWQQEICIPGQPCRGGQNTLVGQEVSQTVEVRVRDLEKAGEILATLGRQEVSNVSSLRFSIDDESILESEAREIAINDAMAKAEVLADQLGVRIRRIVSFHEDEGFQHVGMARESMLRLDSVQMMDVAPEIPAGENIVRRNVFITFEIR